MAKKRKVITLGTVRLYSDQEGDSQIIRWLEEMKNSVYGSRQQAIKAALLRGIQGDDLRTESGSSAAIDWSMLRQVINGAFESVLARMQVAPTIQQGPVDSAVGVNVDIDGLVGIWGDDDDEK